VIINVFLGTSFSLTPNAKGTLISANSVKQDVCQLLGEEKERNFFLGRTEGRKRTVRQIIK
jgi:hypothetical protein